MLPSSVGEKEFDPRVRVTLEEETSRAEDEPPPFVSLESSMISAKLGR